MLILCLKQLNIEKCDQEFIKENKKVRKQENTLSTKKTTKKKKKKEDQERKKKLYFFLDRYLSFLFFLLVAFLVESVFPCFLTFLFSFINSYLKRTYFI